MPSDLTIVTSGLKSQNSNYTNQIGREYIFIYTLFLPVSELSKNVEYLIN